MTRREGDALREVLRVVVSTAMTEAAEPTNGATPVSQWEPFEESLVATVSRTATIALLIGAVVALRLGWRSLPVVALLALWPSFGGHWVEIIFLNHLRPRLPAARSVQVLSRLLVWFVGGLGLGLGAWLTAAMFEFPFLRGPQWWLAGLAFIGIELVAHVVLSVRGRPSFYNGRG
jgi:hypothetical protein